MRSQVHGSPDEAAGAEAVVHFSLSNGDEDDSSDSLEEVDQYDAIDTDVQWMLLCEKKTTAFVEACQLQIQQLREAVRVQHCRILLLERENRLPCSSQQQVMQQPADD